uniref:hypothetical protein n=1 Tax=Pararhizobium sp. IMCC3301 TaxID=3067904 RepID=UPI00274088CD|nr:hypothetical protein [Pararhizobium sp. IMCC3301]
MITNHFGIRMILALVLALPLLAGAGPFVVTGAAAHDSRAEMGRDPRTAIFGRGAVPLCDDPRVLRQVQSKFAWADRNTWSEISNRKSAIGINSIRNIKQRYSLNQTKSLITHRHCDGTATLSNGKQPRLYYLIQERMGFAGISWKVQFCVAGYDRWRVYGASCRTLR